MVGAGRGGGPVSCPRRCRSCAAARGDPANEWNLLSITMDANIVRPILNRSYDFIPGATDERDDYGPIALYAGGVAKFISQTCRSRICTCANPPEQVSSAVPMQRIDEFYQSWGAAAGDFNKDGVLDVVAGPTTIWVPTYTTRGEIDFRRAIAEHQLRSDDDRLRSRFYRRRLG